jgi:hypothetical protein
MVHYKPIATVGQNDLEFLIPGDTETYIDLGIKPFVKGNLLGADGKDLDASDFTAGNNNFLHSLFKQCSISLNGVNITSASELFPVPLLSGIPPDLWLCRGQFASYKRVLVSGRRECLGR